MWILNHQHIAWNLFNCMSINFLGKGFNFKQINRLIDNQPCWLNFIFVTQSWWLKFLKFSILMGLNKQMNACKCIRSNFEKRIKVLTVLLNKLIGFVVNWSANGGHFKRFALRTNFDSKISLTWLKTIF